MNLLSMDGAALAVKDGFLFEELSIGIDEGEGLGLVGRNGAGKTSLLRLLAGEVESDRGTVARRRGLAISVLEQDPSFAAESSLRGFLRLGRAPEIELLRRFEELSARGGGRQELEKLETALEAYGPVSLENRYLSLCAELGLDDADRKMGSLSGGQVKKAALARTLAPKADLVLLDEPTNHLDLETIEWLERRLSGASFAFVLVTHDRWFLDAVCDSILEIDRGRVFRHPGNYSRYLERVAERYAAMEKAENRRLANLKIELAWLNRGARARATKSERRKDEIREMQASGSERESAMSSFASAETRLGKKAIELKGVGKSYDGKGIIEAFSYELLPGARVGVVGPNGSGKTSLLNLVSGRLPPDSGQVLRGETVCLAYFEQTAEALDPDLSVLEYVRERAERLSLGDGTVLSAEQLLERFRFSREFQGLSLGRLSGGELRRLQLVRLLAEAPNVLLLDEPTNNLDIETIELLEDYLDSFSGSLLAVSHDRAFLDRSCETLLVLDGRGGITNFPGRYGDWRASRESLLSVEAPKSRSRRERRDNDEAGPKSQKLSYAEARELESLLEEIGVLEKEKADLEAFFSGTDLEADVLEGASKRYAELGPLIESKTVRWEELASREALS